MIFITLIIIIIIIFQIAQKYPFTAQKFTFDSSIEPLRWFMLPNEAHNLLIGNSQNVRHKTPFDPNRYKLLKNFSTADFNNKVLSEENFVVESKSEKVGNYASDVNDIYSPTNENASLVTNLLDCSGKTNGLNHGSETKILNFSPAERQNSFSSEMSSSDCPDSIPSQQSSWYTCTTPTTTTTATTLNIPVTNYFDGYGYSQQQSLSPHLLNQFDNYCSSQVINIQNVPQKNYSNFSNYDGSSENSFNMDQFCNYSKYSANSNNCRGGPFTAGKLDLQYPANKVHFLLGRNCATTRQRCNSLGSSLIMNPRSRGNSGYSCRSLTDGDTSLNLSECSLSSNEDIQAYVTEVTKELATEIKSEIRGVISKVEDVLSESVEVDGNLYNSSEHRNSKCYDLRMDKLERTNSLPSASASDIAQYLMGVSKEMAEEMKSQIRGLVSSVVSSDSSPLHESQGKKNVLTKSEESERESREEKREKNEISHESISQSCDSGINLNYSDFMINNGKNFNNKELEKNLCDISNKKKKIETMESFLKNDNNFQNGSRESLEYLQNGRIENAAETTTSRSSKMKTNDGYNIGINFSFSNSLFADNSNDEKFNNKTKWRCPTKAVWKPTVKVLLSLLLLLFCFVGRDKQKGLTN